MKSKEPRKLRRMKAHVKRKLMEFTVDREMDSLKKAGFRIIEKGKEGTP